MLQLKKVKNYAAFIVILDSCVLCIEVSEQFISQKYTNNVNTLQVVMLREYVIILVCGLITENLDFNLVSVMAGSVCRKVNTRWHSSILETL